MHDGTPDTLSPTAVQLRHWLAVSDQAMAQYIDNSETPEGKRARTLSIEAFQRCRPLAEVIWATPVQSWADVVARAIALECFHSEGCTGEEQDRAIQELIAAVKIMGGLT